MFNRSGARTRPVVSRQGLRPQVSYRSRRATSCCAPVVATANRKTQSLKDHIDLNRSCIASAARTHPAAQIRAEEQRTAEYTRDVGKNTIAKGSGGAMQTHSDAPETPKEASRQLWTLLRASSRQIERSNGNEKNHLWLGSRALSRKQ